MTLKREAFGISLDAVTINQAVQQILRWIRSDDKTCKYVVTPNVDHIVRLQNNAALNNAYQEASMVLTDGKPVYYSLKWLGKSVPSVVTGSDLVPNLFKEGEKQGGFNVFLLGALPGVAQKATQIINKVWPKINVVKTYSPEFGFENNIRMNKSIIEMVAKYNPDVLIIGLGAPKQEIWIHSHYNKLNCKVALCVGATIDFIAGEKKRAPKWLQRLSLEWLYRALLEPKRLCKRYLYDLWAFPQIILCEFKRKSK